VTRWNTVISVSLLAGDPRTPVPLVRKIGTQVNRRSVVWLMKCVHGWW